MRIFLTGAGGFIGKALLEHLSGTGHDVLPHIRSSNGDLSPQAVPEGTDAIVNAIGRLGSPGVTPDELTHSNTLVPSMLGEVAASCGIHLVHLSTPGVTGLISESREDSPYAGWGDYERSKTSAEKILRKQTDLGEDLLTILRPDFVYGPGDTHKLALFRQVEKGWMPLVGWTGAVLRPTYVADVCRAVELSLPGGCLSGGIFNVGGPETATVRKLAKIISHFIGGRLILAPVPSFVYGLAVRVGPLRRAGLSESRMRLFGEDHHVSIEKASSAGFEPQWDLSMGVEETVRWYRRMDLLE